MADKLFYKRSKGSIFLISFCSIAILLSLIAILSFSRNIKDTDYTLGMLSEKVRSAMLRQAAIDKNMIATFPMTHENAVYVISSDGVILAATKTSYVNHSVEEIGLEKFTQNLNKGFFCTVNGDFSRCYFTKQSDYYIGITGNGWRIVYDSLDFIFFSLAFLILVDIIITILVGRNNQRIVDSNKERDRQLDILISMSKVYNSMHLINLDDGSIVEYTSNDNIRKLTADKDGASEKLKAAVDGLIVSSHKDRALDFIDLDTVTERLKGKKMIYDEFIAVNQGWIRASFINISQHRDSSPSLIFYTTVVIDSEKKKQLALVEKSNTDELTQFFNRYAYEEAISDFKLRGIPDDLVIVSMDVNGLKVVNDSLGHSSGDELLIGAAQCIKAAFCEYGKLFRLGGDEFAAVLRVSENELKDIISEFELFLSEWTGDSITNISVSYGYATRAEFPNYSITDLEKEADRRMYDCKARHYSKNGLDRRNQHTVYEALCNSYLRIIKANLTTDTYSVISAIDEEQNSGGSLSEWFLSFANNGTVAEDKVKEYKEKTKLDVISEYLKTSEKPYSLSYECRIDRGCREIRLEVVRAKDYDDSNQSVLIFVKDIGK
ncbi:MAG: GGDEF domain-containing protein [Lachnospiraceae bacterium]|nr:GGDEF domain-containing protein [Lachnospiraceae bacterium]